MIYSANDFLNIKNKSYDVCIIGSGPSGICSGLELLYSGLTVCTLEGGDIEAKDFFDQLKNVESPELEISKDSRVRAFGGTSNTWSGFIAPLDPIDLAKRGAIHPGWPPEVEIATATNAQGYRYDLPNLSLFNANDLSLDPWRNLEDLTEKIFLRQVPPVKFAHKYGYAYVRKNFDLIVKAVVTSLNSKKRDDAHFITSATFRSASGRIGQVNAKVYILAAGCIENVRLLFNSKDEGGVALGNLYDQLGRGFMNHPKGYVGEVCFNRSLPVSHPVFKVQRRHFGGYVGFRLKESLQETEGLLNSYLRLEPRHGLTDTTISRGVKSLLNAKAAVKSALRLDFRDAISSGVAALKDPKGLVQALKLPFRLIASRGTVKSARVRCFMDMEPSPRNRITLSERSDPLGVAIPVVKYSVSERALKSVVALLDRFSSELSALGIGKFTPYASPLSESLTWDASHHLGGTPMGHDPRTSVVSPELRVHGVDNLYIAGGSAFPTGGNANPTLTMIGLSLRLAGTVRASLSRSNFKARTFPATGHGIIIVGAGRRAAEDVVPAIEALCGSAYIQSIYATRPGVVFGRQKAWDVRPIDELREGAIASASAIYIAVPQVSVPKVLTVLRQYDCRQIRLIVDTPVVSSKILDADYDRFLSVHVAEDSIVLPWLPAAHACIEEMSRVREIRFLNSAYRYHAFALAKAIAREDLGTGGGIKVAYRFGHRTRLRLASGSFVVLHEPRDYKIGCLNICLEDGRVLSSHPGADITIECLRKDDHCAGFSVANNPAYLSDVERDLVGRFTDRDNVVTRMLDFKRVGLYRLLAAILFNRANYSLADGLEDAVVDRALARRHFYHRMRGPSSWGGERGRQARDAPAEVIYQG